MDAITLYRPPVNGLFTNGESLHIYFFVVN